MQCSLTFLVRSAVSRKGLRQFSRLSAHQMSGIRNTGRVFASVALLTFGVSYAAVPLYRLFCQATGYGGTTLRHKDPEKLEKLEPVRERKITIRFNADTNASMQWQFKPQQSEIQLVPGEAALAFYSAYNSTDRPITGMSTYNVLPFDAGQYFIKIQCFCFEEQILNAGEHVELPVFFYIDPDIANDPGLSSVDTITLSYTFFEAKPEASLYYQLTPSVK
ncbi:Cytochrome c oxidase assembly protein COX11, mitochondrial [Oopsacas minuta]|uniref:Cytochrome c oxidase assembly protein COX11, mitochondrial n=1 Tax=Oopsacas minuta TaxID=111878 RepID=A0AAV7K8J6_9METZ|nr:Cytochrome c oxidase assembly protein COX11, mitochondrial [Oopsacas minuta]